MQRYNARRIGAAIPPNIANIPLRRSTLVKAPATDEKGNIHCQNLTCRTQAGNRTRGHTQCIEFKCKSCCTAASLDAGDAHKPRDPCKAHGVESVSDHQYLAGAVVVPAAPAPAAAARRVNGRAAGTRALAQPIGPLWRDTHQKADDAKAAVESLKTRRLEMDAREKKTCELVIFYKVVNLFMVHQISS